ncbi:bifunctional alpha/beta hydrolase/OsmC family protein [Rhabdobacter roseus]|uniref:Putative redox protein n=1 Tax=Rhabdobacter roseus TaxID=1655419 RepID=A0A840TR03_9BACT|nr:bifunctional alpha/beta hydrolase/OsmC family protein [Rhabdobacter roseus]MBB5283663.1 putative redox protein [Rhabdobacter roseus]
MKSLRLHIENQAGEPLAARLELPANRQPHHFALFAHCFTCSKDLAAVRNISLALTNQGFGVVRFDFTGLGESAGDFAETSFSNNIEDLVAVGTFMAQHYQAPSLLVGHSLGGAAALVAGAMMESVKAIATIGAPASLTHVKKLFADDLPVIEKKGYAEVRIDGRPFTIKQQFVEDLRSRDLLALVRDLRKPLLIAHSPQDKIVNIDNAAQLYQAAFHPKSFLSLDGADHLLSRQADSHYVGDVLSSWAKRYLDLKKDQRPASDSQVVAHITDDGYTTQIQAGPHQLVADEPEKLGGNNFGPTPYELVSAGLGACTAITLRMYADHKKWDLQEVYVHLDYHKVHAEDCLACEDASVSGKIDQFHRVIELIGDLDDDQRARLLEIANKCPVHKTLHSTIDIQTTLKKD